jgi:hypothetical protein
VKKAKANSTSGYKRMKILGRRENQRIQRARVMALMID